MIFTHFKICYSKAEKEHQKNLIYMICSNLPNSYAPYLHLFLGGHVGDEPQTEPLKTKLKMDADSKKLDAVAKAALESLLQAKDQLAQPLPY